MLNEQYAIRSERRRKIWRAVFVAVIVLCSIKFLLEILDFVYWRSAMEDINTNTSIIGGFDSPTSIYVSSISIKTGTVIVAFVAIVISIIGLYKTNRK